MRPKEVGIIGFDGVIGSHLTGPADAFTAAVLRDGFGGRIPCYRVRMIGLTKQAFVAESGIIFHPQDTIRTAPPLDTIIVAGGTGVRRPQISECLSEWLLRRSYETRRIGSICTGVYALAPTGLLDGRQVASHWRCASHLRQCYPALRVDHKPRLIKDGPFYTCAGLTGGVDLALALIEEDYGKQMALSVGQELMSYVTPKDQPNANSQPHDYDSQPADRFGELVAWIMRNLQENLTVVLMAKHACMCPAHFTRAFRSVFGCTPGQFVESLRLNEARRRLSSRRKTVRSVAASVGFRDPGTFRRAFERRFGSAPASYGGSLEKAVLSPVETS
jgi:transcriptional regulator GlxA family with amidase domain